MSQEMSQDAREKFLDKSLRHSHDGIYSYDGIYSHDGIRDTFTHLAAPPYFYENLKREIAYSIRSGESISIARFVIKNSESVYEDAILSFSEVLKRNFRESDLIARMGVFEFVILLKTEGDLVEQLCRRLIAHWGLEGIPNVAAGYSHITYSHVTDASLGKRDGANQIPLELLNSLDQVPLVFPSI